MTDNDDNNGTNYCEDEVNGDDVNNDNDDSPDNDDNENGRYCTTYTYLTQSTSSAYTSKEFKEQRSIF